MTDATVLVGGGSMLRSDADGNITQHPEDLARGLFLQDCRALASRVLRIDDEDLQLVAETTSRSTRSVALTPRTARNEAADLLVVVTQHVDAIGLHEWVSVRNTGLQDRIVTLKLAVEFDAVDPFTLRSDRRRFDRSDATRSIHRSSYGVTAAYQRRDYAVTFHVETDADAHSIDTDGVSTATIVRTVHVPAGGEGIVRFRTRVEQESVPDWRPAPAVTVPTTLRDIALDDLAALRMPAPGATHLQVVGAGVPWFLTLFGRDSLLTAILAADDAPDLLEPVLRALAAHQATATEPVRVAEPGKLPHELRIDELSVLNEVPYGRYYGSVDVTPLFLIALGLAAPAVQRDLEANARAAVAWMFDHGGLRDHGFLRYVPDPAGLIHQGWKDSEDAVAHADGRIINNGPVTLCEPQAYAWRALTEVARMAEDSWNDSAYAQQLREEADALQARFREQFLSQRFGVPVLALDERGAQADVVSSNIGHVLWTGILTPDEARAVTDRLLEPTMFTGWGIRTLAAGTTRYQPASYHNGSVWPHDTAIAAVGMAKAGHALEATKVASALLDAAEAFGGTLPELFAGYDRASFPVPIAYAHAARPQAWAAAAVLAALRVTADIPAAHAGPRNELS